MSEDQKMDQLISDDMWVYGYTRMDNGVIYCKDITDSEFRTYAVVRSLVNQRKAVAWPSYDTIAELSGHSKRTAMRNVARLEQIDLIQKITRSGTSNQFIVKKMQNSSVLRNEQDIQEWMENHAPKQPEPPADPKPQEEQKKADGLPYKFIIEYLNNMAETKFNHTGSANQKLIKARWNEMQKAGLHAPEIVKEFQHVIDVKVAQWKNDSYWSKFLRPSTLFGNKFDQYRNEQPNQKPIGQSGQVPQGDRFAKFLAGDDE
jgi:uncharacterized phage protein (TIGR02220 family)